MLYDLLWVGIAWVGGTAAILGSLMAIASLLLWLVPEKAGKGRRPEAIPAQPAWQNRLKVTGFATAIAVLGLLMLQTVPFPQF